MEALPDKTFEELTAEDLRGTEYEGLIEMADKQNTSMTDLIMDEIAEKQRLMEYAALSIAIGRLVGENDITIAEYDALCEKIIDGEAYGDITL
jgi:hypothetical protein